MYNKVYFWGSACSTFTCSDETFHLLYRNNHTANCHYMFEGCTVGRTERLGVMQDFNGVKRKEWDGKEEAERAECESVMVGRQHRGDRSDETERRV